MATKLKTAEGEKEVKTTTPAPGETYSRPDYEPSEMVIKEIMIQKGVSRERAIEILKNPAK